MAQGLSLPTLSQDLGSSIRSFFDQAFANNQTVQNSQPQNTSDNPASSAPINDLLDLGNGQSLPLLGGTVPPGGFQLDPNGTYQFSRYALAASLDFSLTQTTVQATQGQEGGGAFASLQELHISIQASAEFEQLLVQRGREQGGDPKSNFAAAAGRAVERIKAQQIRASLSINLSFSGSSISINNQGDFTSDLESLGGDATLGGFAALLQAFFGDDKEFGKFIANLKKFLEDFGSAPSSAPVQEAAQAEQAAQDVQAPAASAQSTSVNVTINISASSTQIEVTNGQQNAPKDPIVLDLNGNGAELTSAENGATFDLDADGAAEQTATVAGGDGYLALDRNGNGKIDNGRELFGDQNGAANGFAELAKFDSNRDGAIDAKDTIFDQLRVYVGSKGNSNLGQLLSLDQLGIQSINLNAKNVSEQAAGGNRIAQRSYFTRSDGSQGEAVDALLNRVA
jgi:hypothetical protein